MNCEQAIHSIGRRIDGEIETSDYLLLDAHLQSCVECSATEVALCLQDAELCRAFAVPKAAATRLADRVIEDVLRVEVKPWRGWTAMLATAASLLLALVIYREVVPRQDIAQRPDLAFVGVRTGPVEVLERAAGDWQTVPVDTIVEAGSRVRTTPQSQCELRLAGGSLVRLDRDSEVALRDDGILHLLRGRAWANTSTGASPLKISVPGGQLEIDTDTVDVSAAATTTDVIVLAGVADVCDQECGSASNMRDADRRRQVPAQHAVTLGSPGMSAPRTVADATLQTRWVHEILLQKGPAHPELAAREEVFLAMLYQAGGSLPFDPNDRSCLNPLERPLRQETGPVDPQVRIQLVQVLADVAGPRGIPLFIHMLRDPEPDVRFASARGLYRLTNEDFGQTPEQWRASAAVTCGDPYDRWMRWWAENKHRFDAP